MKVTLKKNTTPKVTTKFPVLKRLKRSPEDIVLFITANTGIRVGAISNLECLIGTVQDCTDVNDEIWELCPDSVIFQND